MLNFLSSRLHQEQPFECPPAAAFSQQSLVSSLPPSGTSAVYSRCGLHHPQQEQERGTALPGIVGDQAAAGGGCLYDRLVR